MALDIPLPTALPQDDALQYIPLLLSAIEGFLQTRDVWTEETYPEAFQYMEALKLYVVDIFTNGTEGYTVIGTIQIMPLLTLPDGWMPCDGSSLLRADYAELFAAIGTQFGSVDSTHFNIPNLQGKFPIGGEFSGADEQVYGIGDMGGEMTHTLTEDEMPSHTHTLYRASGSGSIQRTTVVTGSAAVSTTNISQPTGSGLAHNNMPPFLVVPFAIFAGVQ